MIVKSQLRHRLSSRMRLGVLLLASVVLPLSPFTFGEEDKSRQTEVNPIDRFVEEQLAADEDDKKTTSPVEKPAVTGKSAQKLFAPSYRAALRPEPLFKSPGELIINHGFEDSKSIGFGVPGKPGGWGGDKSSVVGPEQGIRPRTGDHMLRLLGSGPQGPGKGFTACEVFQIVDLSKYREFIAAGQVTLNAKLSANRVHRNEQTDTIFAVTVYACDGSTQGFRRNIITDQTLGEVESYIYADKNPDTWEDMQFTMRLPRDATYFGIRVTAIENVSDDATDEFHGHYLDDVSVTLHPRTPSRSNVSVGFDNAYFLKVFGRPDRKPTR